jgi:hypothetical protein
MNQIQIAVDTNPGTTKDVTLTCGDQVVTLDIPDQVFYGVDGRVPDPRFILRDICAHLGPALAQLQVTSVFRPTTLPAPEAPSAPETKDQVSDEPEAEPESTFQIPLGLGKKSK